jgi:hypothetical protein
MMDILTIGGAVVAAVVAAAPVITTTVNRYGSPKVKAGWAAIRMIYNRAYAKRVKEGDG